MFKKDFYTVASPLAFLVGLGWIYLAMVVLKIPGWPAMVGMAGYYAVGGLACHERHQNGSQALKGLFFGSLISWIGVALWASFFKGNPIAMGIVMGAAAAIFVLATKLKFLGQHHFKAMPQAFLGATIYFGLFNTFMMAKGVPENLLFGSLTAFQLPGPIQPHVSGILALISGAAGVILGYVHQNVSLRFVAGK
ncbi:MAG: DUF1097 family protein [Proteobacteria bacterium]|nr:DUF1097 family protein [Pseudomonadota bacterium]